MTPPSPSNRLDPGPAALTAMAGYVVWGLSPLFYKALAFASPAEIVLHRAVWSAPLLLALIVMARRTPQMLSVLADRRALLLLSGTAVLIAANWWVFVFAVNAGRVLDVSLGYFINPLMNVAVGVFIARERFGPMRAIAVGLAALGVLNLVLAAGVFPWIGLFLAASFTVYGYLRKTIATDGRVGLFWETAILFAPSLAALVFLEASSGGAFFESWSSAMLLMLTGPVTVAPLLFFIIGARGLAFAVIGVLQFIAPSLQFAIGIATGEPFTIAHAITFALIWTGLAVFVADLLRFERARRRAETA